MSMNIWVRMNGSPSVPLGNFATTLYMSCKQAIANGVNLSQKIVRKLSSLKLMYSIVGENVDNSIMADRFRLVFFFF